MDIAFISVLLRELGMLRVKPREGQMVSLRPGRIELMPSGRGECLEEPGAPFWPVISH